MTLECTSNNSTGPYKPMNIIRDGLLAKITRGYLKWLWAYGHNYYAHQHPLALTQSKLNLGRRVITSGFDFVLNIPLPQTKVDHQKQAISVALPELITELGYTMK